MKKFLVVMAVLSWFSITEARAPRTQYVPKLKVGSMNANVLGTEYLTAKEMIVVGSTAGKKNNGTISKTKEGIVFLSTSPNGQRYIGFIAKNDKVQIMWNDDKGKRWALNMKMFENDQGK